MNAEATVTLSFLILVAASDYKLPATLHYIDVITRKFALRYATVLEERTIIARLVQEMNVISKVKL